jgi:hypothetical protein
MQHSIVEGPAPDKNQEELTTPKKAVKLKRRHPKLPMLQFLNPRFVGVDKSVGDKIYRSIED